MHLRECYLNVLTNIACSTPKSHPTFWLDSLIYSVCDEFILHDGTDADTRHLCLQTTQTLLRVMEISSAPDRITKGHHQVISHCFKIIQNAEQTWRFDVPQDWRALVHTVMAIFYVISCSSKAVGNVCDPGGDESAMPLISKLVQIGFHEPIMQHALHSSCIAIIGNIARVTRLRVMLLDDKAIQILNEVVQAAVSRDTP